jgi:integrase
LKINDLRLPFSKNLDCTTVMYHGLAMQTQNSAEETSEKKPKWKPTSVQFVYRHRNGFYYVRTYSGGKEKWSSLNTTVLSVAKNRMREHVEAAERQKLVTDAPDVSGLLSFGQAIQTYKSRLEMASISPNTKAFREAGLKLVLRTWEDIEEINVTRITSRAVVDWLINFKAKAKPYVPNNAKSAAHNSTGASVTTMKCALDTLRHVLDVAVDSGHLYANPARNTAVIDTARRLFKAARRARAQRGGLLLPTREEFTALVELIRNAAVSDCKAAANYVQFIAFCGARKNEAAHVTWADINFSRETVRLGTTKNGEERFVPMIGEMSALLKRLKSERTSAEPSEAVLKIKDTQGFTNTACRKLAISRFTTHSLRHLFATTCIEAGVDIPTVARWLGHKDGGALAMKTYGHLRREHSAAQAQKVKFAN